MENHYAAGAISGVVARTCTAPLDIFKVRQQTRGESVKSVFSNLKIQQIFRGNALNCVRGAPASAIQFGLYRQLQGCTTLSHVCAATTSSIVAQTLIYPLDLIKTLWQNCPRSNKIQDIVAQIQKQSAHRIICGYTSSISAFVPFFTLHMVLNKKIKTVYPASSNLERFRNTTFATVPTMVVCYPLDTARRRIQFYGSNATFNNIYRGFTIASVKTIPMMSIRMLIYELLTNKNQD